MFSPTIDDRPQPAVRWPWPVELCAAAWGCARAATESRARTHNGFVQSTALLTSHLAIAPSFAAEENPNKAAEAAESQLRVEQQQQIEPSADTRQQGAEQQPQQQEQQPKGPKQAEGTTSPAPVSDETVPVTQPATSESATNTAPAGEQLDSAATSRNEASRQSASSDEQRPQQQHEEIPAAEAQPVQQPSVGEQPSADSAPTVEQQQQAADAIDQSMGFAPAAQTQQLGSSDQDELFGAKRSRSGAHSSRNGAATQERASKTSRSLKRAHGGHMGVFGRKARPSASASEAEPASGAPARSQQHHFYYQTMGTRAPSFGGQQRQASAAGSGQPGGVARLKEADFPDYHEILVQPDGGGAGQTGDYEAHRGGELQQSVAPSEEAPSQQQQQSAASLQQDEQRLEQDKTSDSELANDAAQVSTEAQVQPQSQQQQEADADADGQQADNSQSLGAGGGGGGPYIRLSNIATINGTSLTTAGNSSGLHSSSANGGEMKLMRIYVIDLDQKLVVGNGAANEPQTTTTTSSSSSTTSTTTSTSTTVRPVATVSEYVSNVVEQQTQSAEQQQQAETLQTVYQTARITTKPATNYAPVAEQNPQQYLTGGAGYPQVPAQQPQQQPHYQMNTPTRVASTNQQEFLVVDSAQSANLSQLIVQAVQQQEQQQQQRAAQNGNSTYAAFAMSQPHQVAAPFVGGAGELVAEYLLYAGHKVGDAKNATGVLGYGNNLANRVAYPQVVVAHHQQQQQHHAADKSAAAYPAQAVPVVPLYIAPQYANVTSEQHYDPAQAWANHSSLGAGHRSGAALNGSHPEQQPATGGYQQPQQTYTVALAEPGQVAFEGAWPPAQQQQQQQLANEAKVTQLSQTSAGENHWRPVDTAASQALAWRPQAQYLQPAQQPQQGPAYSSPDHDVVSLSWARGHGLQPNGNYTSAYEQQSSVNYGSSGPQQQQQQAGQQTDAYRQTKSYANSAPELKSAHTYKQQPGPVQPVGHFGAAHPSSQPGQQHYERPSSSLWNYNNGTAPAAAQVSHVPEHARQPNVGDQLEPVAGLKGAAKQQAADEAPRIPSRNQRARPNSSQPHYAASAEPDSYEPANQNAEEEAYENEESAGAGEPQTASDEYLKSSSMRPPYRAPSVLAHSKRPQAVRGSRAQATKQTKQRPSQLADQQQLAEQYTDAQEYQMLQMGESEAQQNGGYGYGSGSGSGSGPGQAASTKVKFPLNSAADAYRPQTRPVYAQQQQPQVAYYRPAPSKGLLSWETISSVASGAAKRLPGALSSIFGVGAYGSGAPKGNHLASYPSVQSHYFQGPQQQAPLRTPQHYPKSAHYDRDVSNFHRPYPLRHMSAPESYSDAPPAESGPDGDESAHASLLDQQADEDLSSSSSSASADSSAGPSSAPAASASSQQPSAKTNGTAEVIGDLAEISPDGKPPRQSKTAAKPHKSKAAARPHVAPEGELLASIEQQQKQHSGRPKTRRRTKKPAGLKPAGQQHDSSLADQQQLTATTLLDPAILQAAQASGQPLSLDQLPVAEQQRLLQAASKQASKLVSGAQTAPLPLPPLPPTGLMFQAADSSHPQLHSGHAAHSSGLTSVQIGQYKITPQTQFVQSIIEPSRQMLGQYFKQYIGQLGQFAGR